MQKLQERIAALKKASFTDNNEKKQWEDILTVQIMSSDDSDVDDEGKEILVRKPLPWLSDSVQHLKQLLDPEILKQKTPQSLRQMKKRVEENVSTRGLPADSSKYPTWVLQ